MHLDKSGRSLNPGDFIIYGHNLGRCAGLRYGVIIELLDDIENPYSRQPPRRNPGRYKVMGVDDDWNHRAPQLLSKTSTLSFGDRILKIESGQVPPEILELLEEYIERIEL